MADLVGIDSAGALTAHPGNSASPGRRLLNRVLSGYAIDKLLVQLRKQKRKCGGFLHPTSGMAEAYLSLLRDGRRRNDFLQIFRVSPENLGGDENIARSLAVACMIADLARGFDAALNRGFAEFCHQRHMAQTLHALGPDYDEDARRHLYKGLAHLDEARSVFVRCAVEHLGACLERDFGIRAPGLVAELITHAFGLRPKITEGQARYLCNWIKQRT
jgi:hypothetical protein